jgi:hypothetical protein
MNIERSGCKTTMDKRQSSMSRLRFDVHERIEDLDFVHYVDHKAVYASHKNVVLRRLHGEPGFHRIATLPCGPLDRLKLSVKLSRRVFRKRVENVVALPSGSVLAAMGGKIYRIPQGGPPEFVFQLEQGRGTLHGGVALDPSGRLHLAEYCRNSERASVAIYRGSDDGRHWEICYESPPGKLRHFHGCFYDSHADCFWFSSGDEHGENWIGRANREFSEVEFIGDGSKFYSAVNLIPREDGIYFANDDPPGPNYICRLDRQSLEVERLHAINGPAWYGYQTDDGTLLFASTVEHSKTAPDERAHLYASSDGRDWQDIYWWQKDRWRPWPVFQLGVINFPGGCARSSEEIWISGQAMKGFDMSVWKGALRCGNGGTVKSSGLSEG